MSSTKRKTTNPPDGYLCNNCGISGHWIQQCSKKSKRNKPNGTSHVPVPGVDPSQADIDRARELQKIKPPKCFCAQTSRLKKVKKSKVKEDSRAVGKYFFFCSKRKDDEPCRFARPVEDEIKDKKDRLCTFYAKTGFCKKGNKCMFSHDVDDAIRNSWNKNKKMNKKADSNNTNTKEADNSPKEDDKKKADDESSSSSSDDSDDSTSSSEKVESTKISATISSDDSSSSDSDDDDQAF